MTSHRSLAERLRKPLWTVTLAYAVFASLWIYFSDALWGQLVLYPERLLHFGVHRGLAFVAVTASLLAWLMHRVIGGVAAREIEDRERHDTLVAGQRRILESVAQGATLPEALGLIVQFIEGQAPEMLCSILLLDASGTRVLHGAAPSLPAEYVKAIDGAPIGPSAGSCGTAAYTREAVYVEDIENDPRWANYKHLALAHGLRACWSTPIFDAQRRILGTFAMYYRRTALPSAEHRQLIEVATQLASIAIARSRSEQELAGLRIKLEAVVEHLHEGLVITDPAASFVQWNPAATRILGYDDPEQGRAELREISRYFEVATPNGEALPPDQWPLARVRRGEVLDGYEIRLRRRSEARVRHLSYSGASLTLEDGSRLAFVTLADVTVRRATERQLAMQAALLDKAQDAILVRALDDTIIFWNKGAERLYGWSAAEAIGQNAHALINDNSEEFVAARRELLERGEWTGTLRQVARGGRRVIVECRWTLVRNDAGEPESVLAINTDVTDRRSLEQQFLRAQRLESIGTLAGGIAHDLNNVLAPVMMSLDILHDMVGSNGAELINGLRRSVGRGADLVRQVLTFARGLDGRKERVDLRQILREIETVVRDTFPKSIRLDSETPSTACAVSGDATQLHQVLMNLVVNARDAMPQGGTLTLRLARSELSSAQALAVGLSAGRYVRLDVGDDGEGISPEHQDVIFEPFFTTKEVGQGTGLGLSTVQSIVRGHDGAIHLQSALGKGSTFTCWFPLLTEDAEQPSAPALARRLPRGSGECILVVDDEEAIRSVAERILARHGYTVYTAANGREGLAVYRQHRAEIDAVITDVSMPEMDGPALIAALRAEGADIPIIVSSGYVEDAGAGRLLNAGTEFFISKPFSAEILLTTLRGVLVGRD